jgi:hypothetical protein
MSSTTTLINGKHPKIVVIEYYDELISRVDVYAEELLETIKDDEIMPEIIKHDDQDVDTDAFDEGEDKVEDENEDEDEDAFDDGEDMVEVEDENGDGDGDEDEENTEECSESDDEQYSPHDEENDFENQNEDVFEVSFFC